jgi:TolB protein
LKRIFHTTGSYVVEVPPGRMTLEVSKGFAYSPVTKEVMVRAGETMDVSIPLRHRFDLSAQGWVNGSTHSHMNYGGNFHNTPPYFLSMARAEGLQIVSSLVANKDNRILDWQYFRKGGEVDPASNLAGKSMLIFGEENRPPLWGHMSYIGLSDHLISPFLNGYAGTAVDSLYPSNTDLFAKARAQGAATCYVHAFDVETDPLEGSLGEAKGFAVDLALGLVDTLEWSTVSRGSLIPLFHAWNNDFHVAPVGGEDTVANVQDNRPLGMLRTYAHLGSDFSAQAWVNALKQGRTFMTSGPLIEFNVNGKLPGEAVTLPNGGPRQVRVEAKVWSVTRLRKVVIYRNGAVWKEVTPGGDEHEVSISERASVTASGWFAVYAEAEDLTSKSPDIYAQALTNRVRVYLGEGKIRNAESADYFVKWIAKLRNMTADPSLWRTDAEKQHVFDQFQRAEGVYQQRAQEAGKQ